ncbi:MAG: ECF transporter S component [Eubacteriaceae bacterium]|nr:ECF transporter S component [Eubacteriaceae bacterium]
MTSQTKKMTYGALMISVTFVMTSLIKIPIPNGYVHLGDGAVLLSAYILGPWGGLIAAGLGSAGADYFGGFGIYVLPTFLAKGLMAFIFGYFMERYPKKNKLFFLFPAVAVMVIIYYISEIVIYGSITAPLINIPFNCLQGLVGIVVALVLYKPLERFRLKPVKISEK